jgi:hypothetical protein
MRALRASACRSTNTAGETPEGEILPSPFTALSGQSGVFTPSDSPQSELLEIAGRRFPSPDRLQTLTT